MAAGHRKDDTDGIVVVIRSPVEISFDTAHEPAGLIIEADLTAADEHPVAASGVEGQSIDAVGHAMLGPGAADVTAEVEPRPAERRRDIDGRFHWRRWWRAEISRDCDVRAAHRC